VVRDGLAGGGVSGADVREAVEHLGTAVGLRHPQRFDRALAFVGRCALAEGETANAPLEHARRTHDATPVEARLEPSTECRVLRARLEQPLDAWERGQLCQLRVQPVEDRAERCVLGTPLADVLHDPQLRMRVRDGAHDLTHHGCPSMVEGPAHEHVDDRLRIALLKGARQRCFVPRARRHDLTQAVVESRTPHVFPRQHRGEGGDVFEGDIDRLLQRRGRRHRHVVVEVDVVVDGCGVNLRLDRCLRRLFIDVIPRLHRGEGVQRPGQRARALHALQERRDPFMSSAAISCAGGSANGFAFARSFSKSVATPVCADAASESSCSGCDVRSNARPESSARGGSRGVASSTERARGSSCAVAVIVVVGGSLRARCVGGARRGKRPPRIGSDMELHLCDPFRSNHSTRSCVRGAPTCVHRRACVLRTQERSSATSA
jgi:hypothetical protein